CRDASLSGFSNEISRIECGPVKRSPGSFMVALAAVAMAAGMRGEARAERGAAASFPGATPQHDAPGAAVVPTVRAAGVADVLPDVELEPQWRGFTSGCSYLAPKKLDTTSGTYDVVFHFHAGQMADKEIRESAVSAVFVSCGYGLGSGVYADAFASPGRF